MAYRGPRPLGNHGCNVWPAVLSRKGNCFDNAVTESFFGTLKAEYFHLAALDNLEALEAGVHDYSHYYNHERIKLGLQGLSPVEYRLRKTG
jgi:putative transposase